MTTMTPADLITALHWLNDATDLTHGGDAEAYTTIVELIESHPRYPEALALMTASLRHEDARRKRGNVELMN